MRDIIGLIFILVMGYLINRFNKSQEQTQRKERQVEREARKERGGSQQNLPTSTPQVLHNEPGTIREARPKGVPAPAPEVLAPGRQLIEALLGKVELEEEEGDWTPMPQAPRTELPQMPEPRNVAPPPIPVARHEVPSRRPQPAQRRAQQSRAQAPRREAATGPREQKSRQAARSRRPQPVRTKKAAPQAERSVLFGGVADVRRAIVFAEILGPPKAFDDGSSHGWS